MIAFFRNIRKRLLAEGRTFRYIKYALGEIILVVIGILIALEINNHNEINKNDKKELEYLKALYEEIKLDTLYYGKSNERLLRQENAAKYTYEVLDRGILSEGDSLNFINQLKLMYLYDLEVPNPVIWNELQNTGNLRLLKNRSLLDKLNKYYNLMDLIKYRMANVNLSKYSNKGREFDIKTFSPDEMNEYFNNSKVINTPNKNTFSAILNDPEIEIIAKGIFGFMKVSRINVNYLNRTAKGTLGFLKQNIDSLEAL